MILSALLLAAAEPAVSKELQPLAFLVGHCWRGQFEPEGPVDTHCFEPMLGGKHIRDRHEVSGDKDPYRGETVYSWNAEARRVEYTYWNSLGGVSRGSMVPKDGSLDFGDETHVRPDGSKLVIRTLWRPVGASAFEAVSVRGGVTSASVVTYRRAD